MEVDNSSVFSLDFTFTLGKQKHYPPGNHCASTCFQVITTGADDLTF